MIQSFFLDPFKKQFPRMLNAGIRTLNQNARGRLDDACGICQGPVGYRSPFGKEPKVVRCKNCRTESLRPLPTAEVLKEHYRDYVITKTSDEQLRELIKLGVATLEYYLGKTELSTRRRPEIRFLEVGFGNGAGLFAASQLGLQPFGVDLDPVCVANAKQFADEHSYTVPSWKELCLIWQGSESGLIL